MRRFLALFVLAVTIGAPACGSNSNNPSQQPIVFTATLAASNEVPAISNAESAAAGTATITFSVPRDASGNPTGDGTWNVQAVISGVTSGAIQRAHIHNGAAGVNAGVFVDTLLTPATQIALTGGAGTVNFTNVFISQAQAQAVMNNPAGHYFNMHTSLNPGGALRGQLVRQ
jgi:hypothetical protein